MSSELFSLAEARSIRPVPTFNPRCDRCQLHRGGCNTPKMRVDGQGRRGVLICSDTPTAEDDEAGVPFSGKSGRWLESELRAIGFDMRRDAWLTNAVICHGGDETPATAVEDCRPNLLRVIKERDPVSIILLGSLAVSSVLGHWWKSDVGPASRWVGRQIPIHAPNVWVSCVHNPAVVLRPASYPIDFLQFREHLRAAVEKDSRPWSSGPPDYASRVEVLKSPTEAAERLARYVGGSIAVDVETTTLKPDGPHAEIVCCSVCWNGNETIAFPWHGPVLSEMRRILLDPGIGKIASNLDMEDRWFRAKLGIDTKGWLFDTMLGAHLLDARRGGGDGAERGSGCTGLKFLSFARLGMPDYSGHLEAFLKSGDKGCNSPNRVREIPIDSLLKYCGLDSLLEWEIAQQMMAEMEYT